MFNFSDYQICFKKFLLGLFGYFIFLFQLRIFESFMKAYINLS